VVVVVSLVVPVVDGVVEESQAEARSPANSNPSRAARI
jgi:hypothetical protein